MDEHHAAFHSHQGRALLSSFQYYNEQNMRQQL